MCTRTFLPRWLLVFWIGLVAIKKEEPVPPKSIVYLCNAISIMLRI